MNFWTNMNMGHVGEKTRSRDQILKKIYVRCRSNIFNPIPVILGLNVCLDINCLKMGYVGSKTRPLGQILKKKKKKKKKKKIVYARKATFSVRYS